MLTVLALTLCGISGLGCTDEELTAPRQAQQEVSVNTVITSDTICARAHFTITSATAVTTEFPSRLACTTKLVLIRGQAATWAQSPNRRLTLFVRLLNRSGQTLQLPVRLYLPANGITVTAPAGTPASKVVPLGPDSVEAGGGKIWFVGGSGTLAADDSTVQDTIRVNVMSPVTKARFSFQATATVFDTARPPIPTSRRFPINTLLSVTPPGDTLTRYFRYLMGVRFLDSTSGPAVQQYLQHFNATIVAGAPHAMEYILQIPDPGPLWQSFDSTRNAMNSYPGVRYAAPITSKSGIQFDSRYPDDGAGFSRNDWLTSPTSHAIWSRLAVRAPLAWGCETGAYGGSQVKVGVMDYFFDTTLQEWAGSTISVVRPDPVADSLIPAPAAYDIDPTLSHGTGVLGILAAQSDNSIGIPGMMWQADLHLYQLENNFKIPFDLSLYFAETIVPDLKANGVKLFVTSAPIGTSAQMARFRAALEDYLSWGGVVIVSAGNDPVTYTIGSFMGVQSSGTVGLKQALVSFFQSTDPTQLKKRIMLVTGTAQGNVRWNVATSGATIVTAATDIAAPAADIQTLSAGMGSPLQDISGTSLSAPFVAGVAAQLYSMAPALPPDSIKDYILRGAQVSRVSPTTGQPVPASEVNGIPGVYQLDAYGALSLLSKERRGTPICGLNVRFEYPANDPHVILERNPGVVDTIPMPASFSDILSGSVAQGGRLFSITRGDGAGGATAVDEYALVNSQWSVRRTIDPLLSRRYLEQDTVDVAVDANNAMLRGSQWGASGTPIVMGTLAIPSLPSPNAAWFQFAPDGRHALFATGAQPNCAQPIVIEQVWLVTLPAGPSYPVLGTGCNGTPGLRGVDGAWDQTGARFVVGERDETGYFNVGSNYYSMTVANDQPVPNGPPVRVNARSVTDYSFKQHMMDPTGATATWLETGSAVPGDPTHGCYSVTRTTTSFAVVTDRFIPYSGPDWVALCQTPVQALSRRGPALSYRRH